MLIGFNHVPFLHGYLILVTHLIFYLSVSRLSAYHQQIRQDHILHSSADSGEEAGDGTDSHLNDSTATAKKPSLWKTGPSSRIFTI
jgi:hypothetical protein